MCTGVVQVLHRLIVSKLKQSNKRQKNYDHGALILFSFLPLQSVSYFSSEKIKIGSARCLVIEDHTFVPAGTLHNM